MIEEEFLRIMQDEDLRVPWSPHQFLSWLLLNPDVGDAVDAVARDGGGTAPLQEFVDATVDALSHLRPVDLDQALPLPEEDHDG